MRREITRPASTSSSFSSSLSLLSLVVAVGALEKRGGEGRGVPIRADLFVDKLTLFFSPG